MPDRENVINNLEELHNIMLCKEEICPREEVNYWIELQESIAEAIVMLKQQEPVKSEIEGGGSNWWYVCGECHGAIDIRDQYCRHCGKAVIWE